MVYCGWSSLQPCLSWCLKCGGNYYILQQHAFWWFNVVGIDLLFNIVSLDALNLMGVDIIFNHMPSFWSLRCDGRWSPLCLVTSDTCNVMADDLLFALWLRKPAMWWQMIFSLPCDFWRLRCDGRWSSLCLVTSDNCDVMTDDLLFALWLLTPAMWWQMISSLPCDFWSLRYDGRWSPLCLVTSEALDVMADNLLVTLSLLMPEIWWELIFSSTFASWCIWYGGGWSSTLCLLVPMMWLLVIFTSPLCLLVSLMWSLVPSGAFDVVAVDLFAYSSPFPYFTRRRKIRAKCENDKQKANEACNQLRNHLPS